jgi:hypothetical protein
MMSLHDDEDRLAWIFGSSRSGSTWLLRMLSSLAAVVPVDDPHLGHHLGVWRPISLAWGAAEHPPDLTTLDRVKHDKDSYFFSDRFRHAWHPALRRLIADRFDAECAAGARTDRPVVVVKEPGSHVADLLVSLFPQSRLVFLLRDGREDLVADPAAELARICEVLPLDARPGTLTAVAAEHDYGAVPTADKGDGKEIRSATPGGWRDNLTPAEHDVMHEVMGPLLAELGYPTGLSSLTAP